jgi:hypothetical protein
LRALRFAASAADALIRNFISHIYTSYIHASRVKGLYTKYPFASSNKIVFILREIKNI